MKRNPGVKLAMDLIMDQGSVLKKLVNAKICDCCAFSHSGRMVDEITKKEFKEFNEAKRCLESLKNIIIILKYELNKNLKARYNYLVENCLMFGDIDDFATTRSEKALKNRPLKIFIEYDYCKKREVMFEKLMHGNIEACKRYTMVVARFYQDEIATRRTV